MKKGEDNMQEFIARENKAFIQTYKRLPVAIDRAEGVRIYDKNGNVYLDFLAGIAVNALGHSHPDVIAAISNQIKRYMHVSNYFYQDAQIELAEALKEITGFDRVFYSNSGAESIEGCIKLARRWGALKGKNEIIAFTGGFHGRTYGALSIMDKPLYKKDMGPFLEGTKILPYNDVEALQEGVNRDTSAVFLEFIQGEGGITSVTPEFAAALMKLKDKYGFLLIADEVQAGAGRTGKFFGFEHFDVRPDAVAMAKGLGGGLPLGAILIREELSGVWEKGMHGTTYGGNAVSCASGKAVIDNLKNGLLDEVRNVGEYFHYRLSELKVKFPALVLEVRGIGLLKGLLLSFDAGELVASLLSKKVIANAASGSVLRMAPPLIVKKEDIDEFIEKLELSLSER